MEVSLQLLITIVVGIESGILLSLRFLREIIDKDQRHNLETISYHVLLITIIILIIWR